MSYTQADVDKLKATFTAGGQGHVFTFWDSLNETQRAELISHLKAVDVARVNNIFKVATSVPPSAAETAALAPLPPSSFDSVISANPAKVTQWRDRGLKAIAEGKVGVILLAGGQGTRLGSSAPKGCYDIELPSHKSLFQLQAERIMRVQTIAAQAYPSSKEVVVPWYVMTSGPTRGPTEAFFKENKYFGMKPENVIFFEQGVLPAFTNDGKIFMETKSTLAVAPDGNGGIYAALRKEGVIADLEKRGIPYVHAYCVDNCLVKVADPVFIGYCLEKNADCGAKAVPKAAPNEPVGVICLRNNKFNVVEYSEISPAIAELRDPTTNGLVYSAANIANHFYTTEFLKRIELFEPQLEYHIARKKIKHVDLSSGSQISPDKSNGIKLELFIFDVLPYTERMAVLEVPRKEEFSPLKNAKGSKDGDSPDTSRADILAQHVRFATAAGATVVGTELEISPLVSYGGEGLEVLKGKTIQTPKLISNAADLKALAA
ncbi:UDP-N-acetylglucosamine pyrophosphorylase [Chytridiales sp. JEL 0842]|nr:UDP-N-acetylglucosamine pyrophosphorylase [Chytridiales sp. JEL 0842]